MDIGIPATDCAPPPTHPPTNPPRKVTNLEITEKATAAQVYDSKIRTYARELSNFRQRKIEGDITDPLTSEGDRVKLDTSRGFEDTRSFAKNNRHPKGDKAKHPE